MTWYVSGERMTVLVITDEHERIIRCAPIVRRFTGQHLQSLVGWLGKRSLVDVYELTPVGKP